MNRKKAVQSLGIFFLAMCLLTVFSRSMDSFRVAQVTAQTVTKTVLDYSVSGNGKVESSRELAVFTVPEMKVSSLNVQEGEQVKKGELLFQVDLNTLKKKRSSLMTELEQAKLTKEDADSQAKTIQEKQEEEISHARENYDQAVESADQAVAMAQQDLDLAREKLNDFYNTSESSFSGEGQSAQESEQSLLDEIYEKEKALELAFTEREKKYIRSQTGSRECISSHREEQYGADSTIECGTEAVGIRPDKCSLAKRRKSIRSSRRDGQQVECEDRRGDFRGSGRSFGKKIEKLSNQGIH